MFEKWLQVGVFTQFKSGPKFVDLIIFSQGFQWWRLDKLAPVVAVPYP